MVRLAIIGGTGLTNLEGLKIVDQHQVETPYGQPSSPIISAVLADKSVLFLPRHGEHHTIPPHKINYRANLWALQKLGAEQVVAVAAVGGVRGDMTPGMLALPDQIIDYTYGREQSFFSDAFTVDHHIDFTFPYDENLRCQLKAVAAHIAVPVIDGGTYGAMQGPRLETAAEIRRMAQDGCAMVGMTGMPEAYLARELDLAYATCAVMANWAAGQSDKLVTMVEIEKNLTEGMLLVKKLLTQFIRMD